MTIHFFTGFPGFISEQIIRQLFEKNLSDYIYVLVLQTELEKAQLMQQNILASYPGKTIEIVEGDITLPNLYLNEEVISHIAPKIDYFWHLAAIYDLAVPREVAWKVNVHGTSQVNDFVKQLPNLKRYIYFSTAYVAGKREGLILETELIRPGAFKNYYEETKFEAELLVDDLKEKVPLTIIRPGIVKGHSVTGITNKFDGPYFFLNMIDRVSFLPFIPYIGNSNARINVVPVDYITEASIFLSRVEDAVGKTIHLTDPNPHPVREVYRAMVKEMTGKYPKGKIPIEIAYLALQNKQIRKKLGVEVETIDYLTWDAEFDCTIAKKLLERGNIRCPDFLDTLPSMVEFYKKNKYNKKFQIEIK